MKKKFAKIVSCLLCLAMLLSMAGPALAAVQADPFEEIVLAPDMELIDDSALNINAPADDGDDAALGSLPSMDVEDEADGEYEIYPTPHSVVYGSDTVTLPATMQVVYESGIDEATRNRAVAAFSQAGITLSTTATTSVALRVGVKGSGGGVDSYFASYAPTTANLYSKDAAYQVIVNADGVAVLGVNTDAAFYGLTTLKHILYQVNLEGTKTVKHLKIEDYADVAFRGFIEGYYGNPWSVEDRAKLMEFGGEMKMNIYFYAPKDDPKHNSKWRELYTEEELNTLVKPLADAGNASKCYYGFALHAFMNSPFNMNNYEQDIEVLKAKYEQAISVGVRQIALLGDDAGLPLNSSDGANNGYIRILNDLTDWLESDEMQRKYPGLQTSVPFCPGPSTRYAHSTGNDALLKSLAPVGTGSGQITGNVPIIMTGGQVWGHVSNSFASTFTNNVGVGPFYWVNWPCSDNSKGSLVFGGHDITLERGVTPGSVKGIMLNPMQQSEPSKWGIFQNADYAWNLWQSDDRATQAGIDGFKYVDHMGADDTDASRALRELAKHMIRMNGNGNTNYNESIDLNPKLVDFTSKLSSGTLTAGDVSAMRAEFEKLQDAAETYLASGNERLIGKKNVDGSYPNRQEQMRPWLDAWVEFARANVEMMDALACDLKGDAEGVAEHYLSAQSDLEASRNHRFWYMDHYETAIVGGQRLAPFATATLAVVAEKAKTVLDPNGDSGAASGKALTPSAVITNKSAYGGYPTSKMIDGDDDTFFWTSSAAAVNDYVGLDLGSVRKVGRIRIVMGGSSANDYWTSFKLQYSTDNSTWTDAKTLTCSSAKSVVDENLGGAQARYVRILNQAASSNWSQFSEFSAWESVGNIYLYRSEKVRRVSGVSSSVTTEGASLSATTVFLEPGQFVGLKLPTAHYMKGITMDFTTAPGLTLEAGMNESQMEEVLVEESYPGPARYIRLRNTSDQRMNFILRELSVVFDDPKGISYAGAHGCGPESTSDDPMAWFDGDMGSRAKFSAAQRVGNWVLFDLGQTRTIRSLRAIINDTDNDYPRNGVWEVADTADSETWTPVLTITTTLGDGQTDFNNPVGSNGSSEWKHVTANFRAQEAILQTPVSGRYLRYRVTSNSENYLRFNEITINGGEYTPIPHPSFTADPTETRGNEPGRMLDGDMTTGFQPDMTGRTDGSLIYHVTSATNLARVTIVQNGHALSNATVEVNTAPEGEKVWQTLEGVTLGRALNRFTIPEEYENVYDIKLTWGDVTPTFYEIITETREAVGEGGQAPSQEERVPINSYSGDARVVDFNENWKFNLGNVTGAGAQVFNDSAWRTVTLPHDFSIEQDYTSSGEAESGYLPGGTGWYRKSFSLSADWEGKIIAINFGGAYMETEVYLNGVKLGDNKNGYNPFSFVLPAEHLNFNSENVIAVKVVNTIPSSRWYSGSGIYRNVHLTVTDPVHVARYGTYVTTTNAGAVNVKTSVENSGSAAASVTVTQKVYELDRTTFEKKGSAVASHTSATTSVAAGATQQVEQSFNVTSPKLWNSWDKGTPNLYVLETTIQQGDTVLDTYDTEFGFRTIEFTTDVGFKLNGANVKLKGVCQHHDQGALGAEAWYRAMERQVEILMDMGCNAIRVTHNPADDGLIEICNRKGILIIDEAFDCWDRSKNGNSYDFARFFNVAIATDNTVVGGAGKTWAQFVLESMVNRDKNAPCVIMYSLGNEILATSPHEGFVTYAQNLTNWAKAIDPSRPVTMGDDTRTTSTGNSGIAERVNAIIAANGVVGFNYCHTRGGRDVMGTAHNNGWKMYGSETASHVNSRGVYNIKDNQALNSSKLLTSYDKSRVGWGDTAAGAWWYTIRFDYNMGEFVWTGFDYIGEPTPNNGTGSGWVNGEDSPKSSFFGIIDTNGIPKDNYYMYRSMWNEKDTTLHVLPTWDRNDLVVDSNGKVEVVVYSNAPTVRVYLNGTEVGASQANETTTAAGHKYRTYEAKALAAGGTNTFQAGSTAHSGDFTGTALYSTFMVPYETGTLEVKAFDAQGREIVDTVGRDVVRTTSEATKLVAKADRPTIKNDGKDLSYITIDVVDAKNEIINGATPEIKVSVTGNGVFMGLDNGVQPDHTSYLSTTRKAGAGRLVAIVQSTKDEGEFTVTATSAGLTPAVVTVSTGGVSSEVTGNAPVSYDLTKTIYVRKGTRPTLPEKVTVNLADGTQDTNAPVAWSGYDENLLNTVGNEFAITGTVEKYSISVSIGVVVLDEIAALLNYSTAVQVGQVPTLPAGRPAVMADGTVVNAQFTVDWTLPADTVYDKAGTVTIPGTAQVFGETYNVTATVRVAAPKYVEGGEATSGTTYYEAGTSVGTSTGDHPNWTDGNTATVWTGTGDLGYSYDTAQNVYKIALTYQGTPPAGGVTFFYSLANYKDTAEGGWIELHPTRTVNGSTVTYQLDQPVSAVGMKLHFANRVNLAEAVLTTGVAVFDKGSTAELDDLKINGQSVSSSQLASKNIRSSAVLAVVSPVSNHNAAATILPETEEGKILVITESEDQSARAMYTIQLDAVAGDITADDDTNDYDYTKTTATAPSQHGANTGATEGPASFAVDGNSSSFWHSRWSATDNTTGTAGNSQGEGDLADYPEQRYIQLELEEATELAALRYYPRSGNSLNGTVTQYRVEVSANGTDFSPVATGSWPQNHDWKIALFDHAVTAKYVRLYGVQTYADTGNNRFMSCGELRVVRAVEAKTDLSMAIIEVRPTVFDWKNVEIRPGSGSEADQNATVTVTLFDEVLERGVDYVLGYENNVDPGTAYIYATAPESSTKYRGTASATFQIVKNEAKITSFQDYYVRTQAGIAPTLPETVWARMEDQRLVSVPVIWDRVPEEIYIDPQLSEYELSGRVVDESLLKDPTLVPKLKLKIAWSQSVDGISMATGLGIAPVLPSMVTVRFNDGTSGQRAVTWKLEDVDFNTAGTVEIEGVVDGVTRVKAKASIRVVGNDHMTPNTENIALNSSSATNIFPFAMSSWCSGDNNPYQAIQGTTTGSTAVTKRWSDWERDTYHTNPLSWMGVAFETSTQGVTRKAGQALTLVPHVVNKVKVMFVDENGSTGAVTFPADYEIQYYTGPIENLVFDTTLSSGDSGAGNGRVKNWTNSPLTLDSNWRTVSYSGAKPAVPSENGNMLTVEFAPVNTAMVRVVVTPKSNKWVGIQALEAYDMSVTAASLFNVTSVKLGDDEKKDNFTTQTVNGVPAQVLEVELAANADIPKLTVTADSNAAISLTQAARVPGVEEPGAAWAQAVITSEDGSHTSTYIVKFTREGAAGGYFINVEIPDADKDKISLSANGGPIGTEITVSVARGYQLTNLWVQVTDGPRMGELLTVTGNKFLMPPGNVTFSAGAEMIPYHIDYLLNGGTVERHNTSSYNIKTPAFTLYNPTKPGYTFVGWIGGGLTAPTTTVTIDPAGKGDIGDRTYIAVWQTSGGGSTGGGGGGGTGGGGGGVIVPPAGGDTTVTTTNRDGSVTVTTTNPDGLVSSVTTKTDGTQTAVIQIPQNSGSTVSASLPALEVKEGKTPEVTIQNNTGRPLSITVPVSGSNTIVAVRQEKDGSETVIPYSIVDESGLRVKLNSGSQVLRLVDNAKTFDDVPATHWAAAAVGFASSRELFNGMGNAQTFAPTAPMDRAMMTTVLWRLAEKPDASVTKLFDDVLTGAYYEQAVCWGVAAGVVKGTDNGFEPNAPVTRETLAVMLYRAAGSPVVVDEMPRRFLDGAKVAPWAQEAMIWCIQNDIIKGRTDGTLAPQDVANRAEVATMLQRFVDHQV